MTISFSDYSENYDDNFSDNLSKSFDIFSLKLSLKLPLKKSAMMSQAAMLRYTKSGKNKEPLLPVSL